MAWDAVSSEGNKAMKDIAVELYGSPSSPPEKQLEDHLETATRLIHGDYYYIASRAS